MDLAYTNTAMAGFTEEEYEPEIINAGTCVGVVYRGQDCVAFSYNPDMEILELTTDETFLTFIREGT